MFPRLTVLALGHSLPLDSYIIGALIADSTPLSVFVTPHSPDTAMDIELGRRGCIKSLSSFVWNSRGVSDDLPMRNGNWYNFLKANTQLQKIRLAQPICPSFLEESVLPLLRLSFRNLTSLSLAWHGDSIPYSALSIISRIRSLTQVHLTAAIATSVPRWVIDHTAMQKYLSRLPQLRKIAFTNDSYRISTVDISRINATPSRRRASTRARIHYPKRLADANRYWELMSNLNWMYIGGFQLTFCKNTRPGESY